MKTFLIIDGNALLHRAYHALPDFISKDGTHTNAVYGFITMLDKAIESFRPDSLVVCFDSKERTKRKEMFEKYKSQRPKTDDNLISQFPIAREFLISANIPFYEKPGYEADDLIGILALEAEKNDYRVLIMSGDKDLMQLITENIYVVTPIKGLGEMKYYDIAEAEKKFGVKPHLIPDLKALAGDQSDNYKGIEGIGPKTAAGLINKFGNLESVFENLDKVENPKTKKLLTDFKENAIMTKKLSTIMYDAELEVDMEKTKYSGYDENLKEFLGKYQFNSLSTRLFKLKNEKKVIEKKIDDSQIGLF